MSFGHSREPGFAVGDAAGTIRLHAFTLVSQALPALMTDDAAPPPSKRPPDPHTGVARETKREFRKEEKELAPALRKLERTEEERFALDRAERLGLPYIHLLGFPVNTDALAVLPEERARAAKAVVFWRHGKSVRLGSIDPSSRAVRDVENELVDREGFHVRKFLLSPSSLDLALRMYAKVARPGEKRPRYLALEAEELTLFEREIRNLKELGKRIVELPTTEVLDTIIAGAVKLEASDVHVEPKEGYARLRYRIDGVLQDITNFSLAGYQQLLSRVKVLSGLKINIHDVPQDGSFVLQTANTILDVRTSIIPGDPGENIVLRLLDRNMAVKKVEDLGMKDRDREVIQGELKKPDGMILNTGPTGSGKTTTLATLLQLINRPELKIITLEDPIEYRIAGVEQTQVDEAEGYTFSRGLRSILRQDPDVILVGEIRDSDTAETAMHAALTGHLVLTTLHTNDAAGAVPRLIDMGVRPYIMAPAVNAVVAQRLVRKVCEACREEYQATPAERELIRETMKGVVKDVFNPKILARPKLALVRAKGCPKCNDTGYRGRIGVFEIFAMKGEIEQLTLEGADTIRLKASALKQGMTTITQDAMLKVLEKITTLEEAARVGEA